MKFIWVAVGALTLIYTSDIVLGGPINVIRHNQVEPSVTVVIEPSATRSPLARISDACLPGDIAKGAVAVVSIENGTTIPDNV